MQVRPFVVIPQSLFDGIVDKINQSAKSWVNEWFSQPIDVTCGELKLPSNECNQRDWRRFAKGEDSLYCRISPHLTRKLSSHVVGGIRTSHLITEVFDEAITDLLSRIINEIYPNSDSKIVVVQDTSLPTAFFQTGMGYLSLSLKIAGENIPLVLVANFPTNTDWRRNIPKSGLAKAAHKSTVKLTAMLGEVRIDVGALQSLAVGDILRLEKPLHTPVELVTPNGTVVRGYLASDSGTKSIVLVS